MKTLELNQMEIVKGDGCVSSLLGVAVGTVILAGATVAAPVISYWTLAAIVQMSAWAAYDCEQAMH